MSVSSTDLVQRVFAPWKNVPPGTSFPAPAALANSLNASFPAMANGVKKRDVHVDIATAKLFATAALDVWHRAVHSLLVSTLVKDSSPIWSSVSGYYSSHYTMRGLAHLLGYFQLFQRRCQVQLSFDGSRYTCTYVKRYEREHDWYWNVSVNSRIMGSDPFFSQRSLTSSLLSDSAHRDRSNYWDHMPQFPMLQSADKELVRQRVSNMSKVELLSPPELREDKFPDPLSVQLAAYQRVVRFRALLDNTLADNRMWSVLRSPPWAKDYIDYQWVEPRGAVQR